MTTEALGYVLKRIAEIQHNIKDPIFACDQQRLFAIKDGRVFEVRLVEWVDNDAPNR